MSRKIIISCINFGLVAQPAFTFSAAGYLQGRYTIWLVNMNKINCLIFGWLFLSLQLVFAQESIEYNLDTHSAISIPADSLDFPPNSFLDPDIDLIDTDVMKFLIKDLNKDNFDEYILLSNCGNGGCVLSIFDGKSKVKYGSIFGNPLFVSENIINEWPVLLTFSHQSAGSGLVSSYVFDGREYVMISRILLYEKSSEQFFNNTE